VYGKGLRPLSIVTCAALTGAFALAFFYAPMDADQGISQKIFYVHVPMAFVALLGFIAGGVFAIQHLRTGDRGCDLKSYVAIHLSLILGLSVLITGSIWAKGSWGHWWVWDEPTLVSFLIITLLLPVYRTRLPLWLVIVLLASTSAFRAGAEFFMEEIRTPADAKRHAVEVRPIDATTREAIVDPMIVSAAGATFVRNRRGYYVITGAPGLDAHAAAFKAPPSTPALGSVAVELTIVDPSGRYMSRRSTIHLPLDPDPAHMGQPTSLFALLDVQLYPSPIARTEPGWAVVRASVTSAGSEMGIAGALLRVVRTSDSSRLALGLSDARGEALVAVPGIPITTWDSGSGSVLSSEIDATVQAIVDPAMSAVVNLDDPKAIDAAGKIVLDPDDLEARRATLRLFGAPVKLASGRELPLSLPVALS